MALEEFVGILGKTGYSPRTLDIDLQGQHLFAKLSRPARVFLHITLNIMDEGSAPISVGQLYGNRWLENPYTMRMFSELPEEARTEVLAFMTLWLHELTHHLDFLTTPFGLNFHGKTIREYWDLQQFAPILLENSNLISRRLVDFDEHLRETQYSLDGELLEAWNSLRGVVLTLEAWGDAEAIHPGGLHIEQGWAGNTHKVELFNQEFQRITIHGFLQTLAIPNVRDWYLRPLTILETRAVAHSMMWVLYSLGKEGVQPLSHYFASLYDRHEPPDYFLLFDLVSRGLKYENFKDLLGRAPLDIIQHALSMLSSACWYALQAPPPMDRESLHVSSPIVRLVLVLRAYDDFLSRRSQRTFASFVDLAHTIDGSPMAQHLYFRPIGEILSYCREYVAYLTAENRKRTWNPNMRNHFGYILETIQNHLERRNDYISFTGMPEHGNPFFGLDDSADQRLLDHYAPGEEVINWFNIRRNLLFKYQNPEKIVNQLEQHFGMNELVIPCSCGIIISGRLSRYSGILQTTCPKCGKLHTIDTARITKINLE